MKKLLLFLALVATPAFAQNQGTVANHAVPLGRGLGVVGWGAAAPAASQSFLVSNGASSDPSFQNNFPSWTWTINGVGVDFLGTSIPFSMFATNDELANRVFKQTLTASHPTTQLGAFAVEMNSTGSGVAGPAADEFGIAVGAKKVGYGLGTAAVGQIDGVYVNIRNSGPNPTSSANQSDSCAFCGQVLQWGSTGFATFSEGLTYLLNNDGTSNKVIDIQIASINGGFGGGGNSSGFIANSFVGANNAGIIVNEVGSGTWGAAYYYSTVAGGIRWAVNGTTGAQAIYPYDNLSTKVLYLTSEITGHTNGSFSLRDSTFTTEIFNVDVTTSSVTIPRTGHIIGGASGPALTSCGTSPAIVGSDIAGTVTMGTGAPTGCVITFARAYVAAPPCVVSWQATPLATQSYTISTTAITLTQTATSSNKVNYVCVAASGG